MGICVNRMWSVQYRWCTDTWSWNHLWWGNCMHVCSTLRDSHRTPTYKWTLSISMQKRYSRCSWMRTILKPVMQMFKSNMKVEHFQTIIPDHRPRFSLSHLILVKFSLQQLQSFEWMALETLTSQRRICRSRVQQGKSFDKEGLCWRFPANLSVQCRSQTVWHGKIRAVQSSYRIWWIVQCQLHHG